MTHAGKLCWLICREADLDGPLAVQALMAVDIGAPSHSADQDYAQAHSCGTGSTGASKLAVHFWHQDYSGYLLYHMSVVLRI